MPEECILNNLTHTHTHTHTHKHIHAIAVTCAHVQVPSSIPTVALSGPPKVATGISSVPTPTQDNDKQKLTDIDALSESLSVILGCCEKQLQVCNKLYQRLSSNKLIIDC